MVDELRENMRQRDEKDLLKASLKKEYIPEIKFEGIIIPKIVHTPSTVDRAMQWYFNGFIMSFTDGVMIVDPGVDFYSRFTTTGLNAKDIRAIFVSHQHLDHCGDLLVFLDIIAKTNTAIDLILPVNVIDDVLPSYYQKLIKENSAINLIVLNDEGSTTIEAKWGVLRNARAIKLFHSTQHTFGLGISHGDKEIVYISDTGYATKIQTFHGEFSPREASGDFLKITSKYDTLKDELMNASTVICNINDLFYNRHSLTHLSGWDVLDMLEESAAQRLILQHLSPYAADGENGLAVYSQFFKDTPYECIVSNGSELKVTFS